MAIGMTGSGKNYIRLIETGTYARSVATSRISWLVDRQRRVAGPAGALCASKFAPGDFVVATLLAQTNFCAYSAKSA